MKYWIKQTLLLLLLGAGWGCGDDTTETTDVPVAPQVSFTVTDEEMSVVVDDAVRFEARVETPGPIHCNWYVDDRLQASTQTMTYVFRQVGTHTVRFEAYNEAGRVEKSYTVHAAGVPLQVEFSNDEETIGCMPGDEIRLTATVVGGDKQVRHTWKVGDETLSETAEFAHVFEQMGSFEIRYEGVNSDGMRVERSWTVVVDELPLEIGFSVSDETIRCEQGGRVTITATVKNGATGLVQTWKVGDETLSETAEFSYEFAEAGTFVVTYEARNGKGETVARQWTVEVAELPLAVEFSVTDAAISCKQGEEVVITATVTAGGSTGIRHEWKVDDRTVSTTAEFRQSFAEIGSLVVTYTATNGRNETVTRTWTVTVTDANAGYMFEDFESRDALPGHFINGNAAIEGATVKDNPYKTDVNPSNRVLSDHLLKETGTSGYFDMGFSHLQNRSKYRAIRVKVYLGENHYYPRLKIATLAGSPNKLPSSINGVAFPSNSASEAEWRSLIRTNDWNILVYDLIDCGFGAVNFENITSVQFRPLSQFDGSNCSGFDATTNNRTVYYDDIEFLE